MCIIPLSIYIYIYPSLSILHHLLPSTYSPYTTRFSSLPSLPLHSIFSPIHVLMYIPTYTSPHHHLSIYNSTLSSTHLFLHFYPSLPHIHPPPSSPPSSPPPSSLPSPPATHLPHHLYQSHHHHHHHAEQVIQGNNDETPYTFMVISHHTSIELHCSSDELKTEWMQVVGAYPYREALVLIWVALSFIV